MGSGRKHIPVQMSGWRIDDETSGCGNITVKDIRGGTVARIPFDRPNSKNPNDLERARLIVAAPDMREALRTIIADFDAGVSFTQGPQEPTRIAVARDALLKAERGA